MEFLEFTGKTIDDALTAAAIKLETTSDKLEYEVIEKGSSGILGFGSKPTKIKARRADKIAEDKEVSFFKEIVNEKPIDNINKNNKNSVSENAKDNNLETIAREFLIKVFDAMNLEVVIEIKVNEDDRVVDINLSGKEMGILIGKRGQTIDSLQYLVSLVVNRESEEYYRVKLDTENYRARRKATLEELAKNISYKVKRTKHPVSLEPMNPYERRVIHSALQNDKYVTTKSEGEEPYRHVIVLLKK